MDHFSRCGVGKRRSWNAAHSHDDALDPAAQRPHRTRAERAVLKVAEACEQRAAITQRFFFGCWVCNSFSHLGAGRSGLPL